jgi:circadian clock protein KaiC
VVDPLTALGTLWGRDEVAEAEMIRLVDFAKERGMTILGTALVNSQDASIESTVTGISTISDTWIHVSYVVHSGERNRALTVVKSRGTAHSNQVRELTLRPSGISLTDVYTSDGAVLLGTLRWQKEEEERRKADEARQDAARKRSEAEAAVAESRLQVAALLGELAAREVALRQLVSDSDQAKKRMGNRHKQIQSMRRGD